MRLSHARALTLFTGLWMAVPTGAWATTLVSNMSGAVDTNASPQSTFWLAQRFTTDASTSTANFLNFRGARNAAQTLSVYLYDHDAVNDAPVAGATGFGQFDASSVTTTVEVQTLPAIGTITLNPNTTYWVVIHPSDVNTALWTQTTDLGNLSGPGTIENRRAFSTNGGASWTGQTNGTSNLMIGIDVAVVPVELMRFEVE